MSGDDRPHDDGETTTPFAPRNTHEENTLHAGQYGYPQQPPAGAWPGPPPGGGYQQQPAPDRAGLLAGGRRWWVIGGAIAAVVAVVVALVIFTGGDDGSSTGATATTSATMPDSPRATAATTTHRSAPTPPPPPPPPLVDAAALPGLLLPADLINQRMDTTGLTANPLVSRLLEGSVSPPHCTSAWGPAYEATYNGSGYTAAAIEGFFRAPIQVAQTVVSFPDAAAAKASFDRQVVDWNACKSTHIRFEYNGATEADLGVPSMTAGVMSMLLVPTTSKTAGMQCERDMTVRSNVIVDVRACSPTVGSAGLSIASEIAEKIAPAP